MVLFYHFCLDAGYIISQPILNLFITYSDPPVIFLSHYSLVTIHHVMPLSNTRRSRYPPPTLLSYAESTKRMSPPSRGWKRKYANTIRNRCCKMKGAHDLEHFNIASCSGIYTWYWPSITPSCTPSHSNLSIITPKHQCILPLTIVFWCKLLKQTTPPSPSECVPLANS